MNQKIQKVGRGTWLSNESMTKKKKKRQPEKKEIEKKSKSNTFWHSVQIQRYTALSTDRLLL